MAAKAMHWYVCDGEEKQIIGKMADANVEKEELSSTLSGTHYLRYPLLRVKDPTRQWISCG